MDAQQIRDEWDAALRDAGFTSEQCVLLVSDLPPTEKGHGANWWEPGMTITADDDMVTEELAAEANSPECRNCHRVMVRRPPASDPVAIAALSGKLRHELEHARQWDACGLPAFQLNQVADWVLTRKLKGLPRGSTFTNLKPIEQDANAASAMFLRARWPDAITPLLDDLEDAPLVRSLTGPGSPKTLIARMVAFLYLYEDICADLAAEWPFGFAEHLDEIAPGAGTLWRTLEATAGTFGTSPSTGELGPPPPAGSAWEDG